MTGPKVEGVAVAVDDENRRRLRKGLGVEPFDILNSDIQNDDLGWLIEKMRRNPLAIWQNPPFYSSRCDAIRVTSLLLNDCRSAPYGLTFGA